jgi:hypothetical protein
MELVFSQHADSNRVEPANAQNQSRNSRRLLDWLKLLNRME